jgi:amino acid transporter
MTVLPMIAATYFMVAGGPLRPRRHRATPIPLRHADLLGALIAMWNYMGWGNFSTTAGEASEPQKTYSRAMLGAVILVIASHLIPVAAVTRTGVDPNRWTGDWVDVGQILGGETLAIAVGGVIGAPMMSFTPLPAVIAEDGHLPKIFTREHARTRTPWMAILACAGFWALCYPLGFERSLFFNVLLTGLGILLEFWVLVALRIREPQLVRPYRVPGGVVGIAVVAAGAALYFISGLFQKKKPA